MHPSLNACASSSSQEFQAADKATVLAVLKREASAVEHCQGHVALGPWDLRLTLNFFTAAVLT